MDTLRQDVAFGIRSILRKPAFTLVAALMLAIGIGANTAVFSVVNAVVLKPLAYDRPEELFYLGALRDGKLMAFSAPEFQRLREEVQGFGDVATWSETSLNLVGEGDPERVPGARVTANLLTLLGVEPILGRSFHPDEERVGNDSVVLLTAAAWRRRFGADSGILGRTLDLDGREHTVVGVLPDWWSFPAHETEILVPIAFSEMELSNPGGHFFIAAVGRLAEGVSAEAAVAEADRIVLGAMEEFGADHRRPHGATATPMHEFLLQDHRAALQVLMGAVAFVLLIACANVASLLLAKAAERQKEIAIRAAIGASRARLVRQLLTESVLLALLGGGGGLLLALWGVDLVVRLSPKDLPRLETVSVDWSVFAFAAAISIGAGVVFGLLPAFEASNSALERTLRASARGESSGAGAMRSRRILAAAEVALALVLLVGAGLTLRSFSRLSQVSPGFLAENLLSARLVLPESRYGTSASQAEFARRVLEEVRSIEGVRSAGLVAPLPLTGTRFRLAVDVPGRPALDDRPLASAWRAVEPGYFATMGIPLLAGRDLTDADSRLVAPPSEADPGGRSVLVVNDAFARRVFPGEDPVGKLVRIGYDDILCEIVGVVGGVRDRDLATAAEEEMYTPFAVTPLPELNLAMRVGENRTDAVARAVREAVWRVDPQQPVFGIAAMPERVRESVAPRRFLMTLLLAFAAVALLLAALGIYAVVSYSVVARTREIGIRVALGARSDEVLLLVITQGVRLAAAGTLAGLVSSFLLGRFLASQLYETPATDLATHVAVAAVLVLVVLSATALPARRASRVDPIAAMRQE
jgi:putative ABC transport system permease protein